MAKTTDVTPTMVRDSGSKHLATRDSIKNTEDRVTSSVEFLGTTNAGDLMKKLKEIQIDWTHEMEQVQNKLRDMADYMEKAAQHLESQNASHAGDLK
jgi:uncharacterized protein YukE